MGGTRSPRGSTSAGRLAPVEGRADRPFGDRKFSARPSEGPDVPSTTRIAVALLAVSLLLFASPLYAGALLPDEPGRSSRILGARELGESFEGDPRNETEDLVDTFEAEHVLDLGQYAALSARGSTDHLPCNRDVDGTVAVMREATADGAASTTDDEVAADLQCMAGRYDYYWPPDDQRTGVRTFAVATDGSRTRVETRPANTSAVAAAIRERELVRYGELNASGQRTVDRILDNSSEETYGGYRPRADDPILDRTPVLVRKDGTTYVVETVGHVDDFNFAPLLLYLALEALAIVFLLGAVVVAAYGIYRRRTEV